MRDLPLAAAHARAGVRFTDVAGWRVPLDYGDGATEQRSVHTTAGLIDWSARGRIRVAGPEALPFLDNLLTNDLEPLRDGQGLYAALLEHRGHVVGDLAVLRAGDDFLLDTDAEAREPVLASLSAHLISDDATIVDATPELVALGVFGPASREMLLRLAGTDLPHMPYAHLPAAVAGVPLRVVRNPYFGGEVDAGAVWRELVRSGAVPFGHAAEEALRIEAGRPRSHVDMDERTLALEARLEPAISMTKGCYLGQEVVARIVNQGHVNRLLVGFDVEAASPPKAGAAVLADGERVGHVTSVAQSALLGRVIALGYVRREHAAAGTGVLVDGDPPVPARVAALPFVR